MFDPFWSALFNLSTMENELVEVAQNSFSCVIATRCIYAEQKLFFKELSNFTTSLSAPLNYLCLLLTEL